MDKIKYKGLVTIDRVTSTGEIERIFSFHNVGTSNLVQLLLRSLDYTVNVNEYTEKPSQLVIGYERKQDGNIVERPIGTALKMAGNPEQSEVASNSTVGSIAFTFYIPPVNIDLNEIDTNITLADKGNIFLWLKNRADNGGNTLAKIDTGITQYVVADDETNILKWILEIDVGDDTSEGGN